MSLPAPHDAVSAWNKLSGELRDGIGESAYDIWLAPLQAQSFDGRALALSAPPDTAAWLAGRYGRVIAVVAGRILGGQVRVVIDGHTIEPATAADPRAPVHGGALRPPAAGVTGRAAQTGQGTQSTPPDDAPNSPLNPRYRFEQFVIGPGNHLAHAAALAVAENPGQAYNPLFLYAPPGFGKTHLLHAIGNYVTDYSAGAVVRLATAESFTNHFISALRSHGLEPFKRAYRDADVLLIDDVQFLASKAKTEEEFFHTFNALYETGRQLVLTCDRLPRALTALEQRLRERFEAGLVAEIAPPDHATRVAILAKRAALDQIDVADGTVLDLIANRVTDNVRTLEGALIRVVAYHSLTRRAIDAQLTAEVLDTMYPLRAERRPGTRLTTGATDPLGTHADADADPVGSPQKPTIAQIQATVASRYGLTVSELVSASRAGRINWPRQLAIQLARDLTDASLPAIGRAFGGRNHATILHACKRVSERLKTDPQAVDDLHRLRRQLSTDHADRGC